MSEFVNIDYEIIDDVLYINSINVLPEKRRLGIGAKAVCFVETIAKNEKCNLLFTPADLSKVALQFWLKNGFSCVHENDNAKVDKVLNSLATPEYIFDIDENSVVELSKIINS